MEDKKLSLVEHLEELKSRVIKSIVFIIISAVLIYNYIDILIPILIKPVGRLVFISPQEAFIVNIKIAFLGGLFLSSPVILYQLWRFISRALKRNEKKYALIFGLLSFVFFISGCVFGYFIIIPIGMNFLLGFSSEFVRPMISISKYVSFAATLIFAFSLVFQLPLIILFLTQIGVVTPKFLSKRRKEVLVFIFILAAVFTPPDVITQILMALPLIILYELGVIFSKIMYRSRELQTF